MYITFSLTHLLFVFKSKSYTKKSFCIVEEQIFHLIFLEIGNYTRLTDCHKIFDGEQPIHFKGNQIVVMQAFLPVTLKNPSEFVAKGYCLATVSAYGEVASPHTFFKPCFFHNIEH